MSERRIYTFKDYGDVLKTHGLLTDEFRAFLKENQKKIVIAPFSKDLSFGSNAEGSLIDKSIELAQLAVKINEELYGGIANNSTLVSACILSQLHKIFMYEKATEDWEIKRGVLWKYAKQNEDENGLRTSEKSYAIVMDLKIPINKDIYSGILAIDKPLDDTCINLHGNLIESIIRQANVMLLNRHRFEINHEITTTFNIFTNAE